MENKISVKELLNCLNPSSLDYAEWVRVGVVLKNEGCTAADWEAWSKTDNCYKPGECFVLWENLVGQHDKQDLLVITESRMGSICKLKNKWEETQVKQPQLIKGLLRRYQKMALCGPRRSSKTSALIELTIAVAEGQKWLEWDCVKGAVLFINLEETEDSCLNRFYDGYQELGISPDNLANIDMMHLRGKSTELSSVVKRVSELTKNSKYRLVVIDSITKTVNSMDTVASNLLDKLCFELGCCLVYSQSVSRTKEEKKNIEEVIEKSPLLDYCDTYLEFVELKPSNDMLEFMFEQAETGVYIDFIKRLKPLYFKEVSPDDLLSISVMRQHAKVCLQATNIEEIERQVDGERKIIQSSTSWRIKAYPKNFTIRKIHDYWFSYPKHKKDKSKSLGELQPGQDNQFWKQSYKGRLPAKEKMMHRVTDTHRIIKEYLELNSAGPTKKELAELLGNVSIKTVERRVKESGELVLIDGRYEFK